MSEQENLPTFDFTGLEFEGTPEILDYDFTLNEPFLEVQLGAWNETWNHNESPDLAEEPLLLD